MNLALRGSRRWPLVAVLVAALTTQLEIGMTTTNAAAPASSGVRTCAGRIDTALPAGARTNAAVFRLNRMRAWTETIERGSDPAARWSARLATVSAATPDLPSPLIRQLALPGVGPAAWYHGAPLPSKLRRLVAMKPFADHVLFVEIDAAAGRESAMEQVVGEIFAGYRPASEAGFCVGAGAFVLPPARNESVRTRYLVGDSAEVSIESETIAEVTQDEALTNPQSMTRQLSESGLQLRVLSQSPRRLGGLEGTETLTEAAETGKAPTLTYTWSHPGVPADSLRPRIVVRASAPSNRREALDALWAMVAGSLRMRAAGTP